MGVIRYDGHYGRICELIQEISTMAPHERERLLTYMVEESIDARKGLVRCEIDEVTPENVWCVRCGLIATRYPDGVCCDCKLS